MVSTLISTIITDGLREAGIVEVGGQPDGAEMEEGLKILQRTYSSLFGNELGENLENVNYGSNALTNTYAVDADQSSFIDSIYTPENLRIICNLSSARTIYLYPNPNDGARLAVIDNLNNFSTYPLTVNGNGRQIEDAQSVTLNTNGAIREWFYRADLADWTKTTDLATTDISPLPVEFDDLLTTALAIRLNPRYGAQTDQSTEDVLKRMRTQMRARYHQVSEQRSEDALIRIPSNKFWRYRNASTAFVRGRLA